MKIKHFIFLLLIVGSFNSCIKDDQETLKKSGHFLSKVFINNKISEVYKYNSDGLLIEIDRFIIIKQDTDIYKMLFEYNSRGFVSKWTYLDTLGSPYYYEKFEYNNNDKLIKRTGYSNDTNSKEFLPNLILTLNYNANQIEMSFQTGSYALFEYDSIKMNICKVKYYSYNKSLYLMIKCDYDNKKSPLTELGLPLPLNMYNEFSEASYYSLNNIKTLNSISIRENGSVDSTFTFCKNYEYQYDNLGYPINMTNGYVEWKFEYIDMK